MQPSVEESMVQWLRENPAIWDSKLSAYRDVALKDKLWQQRASEIGLAENHIRQWWRGLRCQHLRVMKKVKNGCQLTEREGWVRDNLDFIKSSRKHRSTAIPVSIHEMSLI